jgi:glycosyltransferase involved in cell wall biosynthesis
MNILFIIPNLKKGGAERLVLDICNEIKNHKGHKLALVTFSDINEYGNLCNNINWDVIPAKYSPSILKKPIVDVDILQKFINQFKPDIIHSHLWESEILLTQINIGNAVRYTHFHDNMVQLNKLKLPISKKEITNYYEKIIVEKNYKSNRHYFVCISNDTFKYAHHVMNKKLHNKIYTLNNAINFNSFNIEKENVLKEIKLLNIGSFVPKKNQKLAIDILHLLKKEQVNVKLVFLGDGPMKSSLEQYAKDLNLSKYISFKGKVSNIKHYLKTSNMYLHTANYEPFGLVILEAMAAGLPVISLDGKGNRDIITNEINGYILSNSSPSEFVIKIQKVFSNKEHYDMFSKNGKETAKKHDIKNYVKKLLSFYNDSISSTNLA